jgi:hypothetical protein
MLTIELMGGLGNQLFQIFAVIGYSLHNRTPFFFEDKEMSIGWRKKKYWETLLSSLKLYLKPTAKNLNAVWRENHFHYAKIPYLGMQDTKLLGYFQSYKYFDEYKKEIFELIDLKAKKESVRQKINLADEENTVSIHFRIGDYKTLQAHHPILSLKYYETALYLLMNQSGKRDWNVLYVCEEEDIDMVNAKIKKLREGFPKMTFTKLDGAQLDDWEQMLAMSICRHQIIANSTFSWFGAYFNTHPTKLVYYPNIWFGPAQGTKNLNDLCPDEWQKIIV